MKRFATDVLILLVVSACVAALMFLPPQTMRRIDRNWGRVIFDDPVTFATAERLADTLVKGNEFNGRPQTYRLTKDDDTTTLAIFVQRGVYDMMFRKEEGPTPSRRDYLINNLELLCYEVFPDERARVILVALNSSDVRVEDLATHVEAGRWSRQGFWGRWVQLEETGESDEEKAPVLVEELIAPTLFETQQVGRAKSE